VKTAARRTTRRVQSKTITHPNLKCLRFILLGFVLADCSARSHLPLISAFDIVPPTMDSVHASLVACPHCAFQMPENAAFCPGCGRPMQEQQPAHGKVGVLPEPIAGAVAYFTFIPAILFLCLQPYNQNRFICFHSVQCLLLWGATVLLVIAVKVAGLLLFIIPVFGPLLVLLVSMVVALAMVATWLILVIKAFQGRMFRLPLLGDFAAQKAERP